MSPRRAAACRIHLPLAIALGREVHHVDDAGKIRVLFDDGAYRLGQMLANILWGLALRPLDGAISGKVQRRFR
jgi:hypothetical protein